MPKVLHRKSTSVMPKIDHYTHPAGFQDWTLDWGRLNGYLQVCGSPSTVGLHISLRGEHHWAPTISLDLGWLALSVGVNLGR